MLHTQLVIHRMHLDGVEVGVRHGTVVAVMRAESSRLEWEVVAQLLDEFAGELGRLHVELLCITHATDEGGLVLGELSGDAIVVRFVDRSLVLRGDGPLSGLDVDLLRG